VRAAVLGRCTPRKPVLKPTAGRVGAAIEAVTMPPCACVQWQTWVVCSGWVGSAAPSAPVAGTVGAELASVPERLASSAWDASPSCTSATISSPIDSDMLATTRAVSRVRRWGARTNRMPEGNRRSKQASQDGLPQFLPQLVPTSCRIRPPPTGQVARSGREYTAFGPYRVGSVSGLISVRSEVQLLPGPYKQEARSEKPNLWPLAFSLSLFSLLSSSCRTPSTPNPPCRR
jgi:hypothetical protein